MVSVEANERGVFRGDIEGSLLCVGQAAALIEDILSAQEFIERMVAQARTSAERVAALASRGSAVSTGRLPEPLQAAMAR